ncbi:M48 family metallopeptidase [Streptomyces sp. NBC_00178]|uniref:M48 family metallopeptidase n=1 Tax=Streptomyces sp. NBC_00178 TaxID=2975672 RepID=UPI002E2C6BC6|nr:M48 family metallopeptidase [Streptomyces sp. NBC_00178]
MQVVDEERVRPCPQCGTEIRTDSRFTTWCSACDWNVDPVGDAEPERSHGPLERMRRATARRHGELLHARVSGDGSGRRAGDLSVVLAYAIACAVHGVTVVLAALGVWCVVAGWGGFGVLLGLILLFVAWNLRPRLPRLPEEGPLLRRDDAPALYGLVDEIARVAGTRGVDVIAVDTDVNAGVMSCGVRGRRLLTLGLPLWEVLTPQQRIALLGHELGHYGNGDTRRGIIPATAYRSLVAWWEYTAPTRNPSPLEMVLNLLCLVPRALIVVVLRTLDKLTMRSTRHAEYLADSFAAEAGSSVAAAELMDRLLVLDSVVVTLQRASNDPRAARRGAGGAGGVEERAERLWASLAADAASVPEHEYERSRRVSAIRGHCVDATHPPTHLRRERLLSLTPVPAAVVMDDEREQRISEELADARRLLARRILTDGFPG